MSRLFLFAATTLLLWIVIAVPARLISGDVQAVYAGIALALCGIPALATLAWITVASNQSPQSQFVAIMAGTGLRLAAVSAIAWLLLTRVPFVTQEPGFGTWVLVAYLLTLTLEITLALKGRTFATTPRESVG